MQLGRSERVLVTCAKIILGQNGFLKNRGIRLNYQAESEVH